MSWASKCLPVIVLCGAAAFFGGIASSGIGGVARPQGPLFEALFVGLSLVALVGLLLPAAKRLNIALLLASVVVSLAVLEAGMTWFPQTRQPSIPLLKLWAARNSGRTIDWRRPKQVVLDLRASGRHAVPALLSERLLRDDGSGALVSSLEAEGKEVLPISGLARMTTVHCNESGKYVVYESDERGFRNPVGGWSKGRISLALVGDSFVHGDCVGEGEDIAGRLRGSHPDVLSLGMRNNGPLLELGSIAEFLPDVKPEQVVWVFYEGNDLRDIMREYASALLRGYLETAGFSQELVRRKSLIDQAALLYLDQMMAGAAGGELDVEEPSPDQALQRVRDFVLFRSLRSLMGLTSDPEAKTGREFLSARLGGRGDAWQVYLDPRIEPEALDLLFRTLQAAKRTVESWGGRLSLAYVPGPFRYCFPDLPKFSACGATPWAATYERMRHEVEGMARRLSVDFIDTVAFIDRSGEDPGTLFYYYGSHPNPDGYRIIAQAIAQGISATPGSGPAVR